MVQNLKLELSGFLTVSETNFSLYSCLQLAGADHTARIEEPSLKSEPIQPASPELVEGQKGLPAQHSQTAKDEEEDGVPSSLADKLDVSRPPEESIIHPAQPPFDGYEASAPIEPGETGHGGLYESIPAVPSDDRHTRALEARTISSRKSGSEEPGAHHMEAPAKLTVGEGKHREGESNSKQMASILPNNPPPVLEEATQEHHLATANETTDTVVSHSTQSPFKSSATTNHDQPQPFPAFAQEPVADDASVPVLSNDHTPLDHRFTVGRSSPQQEAQVQHAQVTNGMFPLILMG